MSDIKTWRYFVADKTHHIWAIAFMDSAGTLSITSDCGSYGYFWHKSRWCDGYDDFRKFIVDCYDEDLLNKINYMPKIYDGEATCNEVKLCILHNRRDGRISQSLARYLWETLTEYSWLNNEFDFYEWYYGHMDDIEKLGDPSEFYHSKMPIDVLLFSKHLLPKLKEAIKSELYAENNSNAETTIK